MYTILWKVDAAVTSKHQWTPGGLEHGIEEFLDGRGSVASTCHKQFPSHMQ